MASKLNNKNKSVTYSSTRGSPDQLHLDFRSVVMQGLAKDRGLFVPDEIPRVSAAEMEAWRPLSYAALAVEVLGKFIGDDQVPRAELERIVHTSCRAFRVEEVTPLVKVNGHYVLELFHGPTLAFKDVALQMLGNFFEYFLKTGSNGGRLTVLGATSGDTGSAAIYGLRGKEGVECVILYPKGRVSAIQERQMTSVLDTNVHCVAVEDGTFDDCQDLVKACFRDETFRDGVQLGAVNSINWCRVLAQTTYYVWSCLRVTDDDRSAQASFSVPTGNFGDVLAGYYARRMGLPVDKLVVATNENDILHRFFSTGKYHREDIQKTISPSMDICVSSNFERYLYHLAGDDATTLKEWMEGFESTRKLTLEGDILTKAQNDFLSARADTAQTLATIKEYYYDLPAAPTEGENEPYLLCPHSAVGVAAVHQLREALLAGEGNRAIVALATAHAGKFGPACEKAINPLPPPPPELACLARRPTRTYVCPKDLEAVQSFVRQRVDERQPAVTSHNDNGNGNRNGNANNDTHGNAPAPWTLAAAAIAGAVAATAVVLGSTAKRSVQ